MCVFDGETSAQERSRAQNCPRDASAYRYVLGKYFGIHESWYSPTGYVHSILDEVQSVPQEALNVFVIFRETTCSRVRKMLIYI